MIIKDVNLHQIGYPVGEYVQRHIRTIKYYAEIIKRENKDKKKVCLFCMGSSGAIISAIVCSELDDYFECEINHIKKIGENSHSSATPSMNPENFNVIVDDFIATGETIQSILYRYDRKFDLLIVSGSVSIYTLERIKYKIKKIYVQSY